jgi:wyosine [tRNA(Phe)-imidazoG37] synthetase (radical SAM superfamily)
LIHFEHIGLCGSGEPFASPSLKNFLQNIDSKEYPELKISILSNGLLFDEKAWNSLSKCHTSIKSVQISVDAASEEKYEKIRLGGSFKKLYENLKFISLLRKNNHINEFIISFVVNSINFSEMDSFVKMGLDLHCDQVYFSLMNKCESMSNSEYKKHAIHLPTHEKHKAFRKKLEDPIFDNSVVLLGNIKRYKHPPLLRDSMFS